MKFLIIKRRTLCWCGVLALVLVLSICWIPGRVIAVSGQPAKEIPIYSVETKEKKIAISFDAAWGDEKTLEILEILDQYQVKATFFLVGFWVDAYPQHVQTIAQRGHEIGNHSTTHPHMSQLSQDEMKMELDATSRKIQALTGQPVRLFRPPFGDYSNDLIQVCRDNNYTPIQWDVDSLDWKNLGTAPMVKRVTEKVQNGSIVLFHNNSEYIAQALPEILAKLQKSGYEIVPISQLIYPGEYKVDHTGRQIAPSETGVSQ